MGASPSPFFVPLPRRRPGCPAPRPRPGPPRPGCRRARVRLSPAPRGRGVGPRVNRGPSLAASCLRPWTELKRRWFQVEQARAGGEEFRTPLSRRAPVAPRGQQGAGEGGAEPEARLEPRCAPQRRAPLLPSGPAGPPRPNRGGEEMEGGRPAVCPPPPAPGSGPPRARTARPRRVAERASAGYPARPQSRRPSPSGPCAGALARTGG